MLLEEIRAPTKKVDYIFVKKEKSMKELMTQKMIWFFYVLQFLQKQRETLIIYNHRMIPNVRMIFKVGL